MRVKYFIYIVLLIGMSWLPAGCAAPAPDKSTAASAPVTSLPADLTPKMAEELRVAGEIVVLDVREANEYAAGRIPGSMWIPLGELADRADEVPADKPVALVCRSGSRSAQAVQILQKAGLTNIHNIAGGMNAWIADGYVPEADR